MSPAVTSRARTVVWVVLAAVLCVLAAPPVAAAPTPAPAPSRSGPSAAAAPLADFSSRLPRTTRDEVTGDFLGLGYDQHMRAEGSALNIYAPPALGGGLLRTTPLDLAPPPEDPWFWYRNQAGSISPWADYILASDCLGCFAAADSVYHLRSVYLAVVGDWLYISGTKGDSIDGGNNDTFPPDGFSTYRNLLYKVPANGTCAIEDCADIEGNVADLPTLFAGPPPYRSVGVTALAAGTSGGNPFVAVGLTDFGTFVYNGDLTSYNEYAGAPTGYQTPVDTLAFDPAGSGMLAVGLLSPGAHSLTTQVNPDGTVTATRGYLALGGGPTLNPFPLTSTFGHKADGSLVVAWGYNDGSIRVGDPQALASAEFTGGTAPAGISVMDAVPRPEGGADDYAIAAQTTADITGPLFGQSWRWNDDGSLTPLEVSVDAQDNPTTVLPSRDAYRRWFPGFKQGRFTVQNNSGEQVTVSLYQRPDPGYGCWWAGQWADAGPFPENGLILAAGQSSTDVAPSFVMGAYTAGPGSDAANTAGKCAAGDASGEWRGYLIITPTAHPADARLVNLHLQRNWTLDVTDQTGGSTTVSAQKIGQLGALGEWQLTVDTPDAPAPTGCPQVNATVLTTPLRGRATVYRFDVGALKWNVPTAPNPAANPAVQTIIPPLNVEGLGSDGKWHLAGYLMPITRLTADPTSVTVGASTFYWENTTTATYSAIRVRAGSLCTDQKYSIVLAGLPSPTPPIHAVTAMTAEPTANVSVQKYATPAANGVDQSTLTITLTAGGVTLPPTDPAYQAVYYRTNGNLITNLYGTAATNPKSSFDGFIGVQPEPGAVIPQSRNSSTAFNDYVSTTDQGSQTVTAMFGNGANQPAQPFTVDGGELDPQGPAATVASATGFSLEGCSGDFSNSQTCRIANATASAPALYQAAPALGPLPLIGAGVGYQAFTSTGDLPMEWQTSAGPVNLHAASVGLKNLQAQAFFSADPFLPADNVDISLVTHGQTTGVTVTVGG